MVSLKCGFYLLALLFPFVALMAETIIPPQQFSSQYYYYRAQHEVIVAERCLQDLHFGECSLYYRNASEWLALSFVEDKVLEFRIDIGMVFSDAFNHVGDVPLSTRLNDIFKKYSPLDKIEFESIGGAHDNKSFPEAQ